jgi:hypothetical protein
MTTAVEACAQQSQSAPTWTRVAHLKVGRTPSPITLGGRWAFVANTSDGTVTQIDRGAGTIVATIKVADTRVLRAQGCAPDSVHALYSGSWYWRACDTPYAMAWDGASLWALDNGHPRLIRIDPNTHQSADEIDLPGSGWDVGIDGTTAWVSGYGNSHSLYAVDLRSRSVKTVSNLDGGTASLTVGGGSVWVNCARGGTEGIGYLDQIDPASAKVVGRYQIEWWSTTMLAYDGAVFVRGGFITRINATTGAVDWKEVGYAFIGRPGIDELGATRDGIWLSGPTTVRIDTATGRVTAKIEVISQSVAAVGNEVWLVEIDGSVSKFRFQ